MCRFRTRHGHNVMESWIPGSPSNDNEVAFSSCRLDAAAARPLATCASSSDSSTSSDVGEPLADLFLLSFCLVACQPMQQHLCYESLTTNIILIRSWIGLAFQRLVSYQTSGREHTIIPIDANMRTSPLSIHTYYYVHMYTYICIYLYI